MTDLVALVLILTGAFASLLGVLHFTFPRRFGFYIALGGDEPRPADFRLGSYRHALSRSDLRGLIMVTNHAASFVILSIGVFDLCAAEWSGTDWGSLVSAWAGCFWVVRAVTQLYLGTRKGDRLVMAVFAILGCVQFLPLLMRLAR